MPKVPQPKGSFRGKKKIFTIVGVILLILVAAGAGVFLRWQQTENPGGSQDGGDGGNTSTGNTELDGLAQNPLPDSVKDAQNLASTGKLEESNKQLGVSIANASNNDEKYELYLQQAINNENAKKWDDAVTSYKSAEAIKKTYTVYFGLGRVYEGKGDKQAAINSYKAAIPLIDANDPMRDFDKRQLEDKVKALGG
jgi:tetratricopeptide (TPR) repeat protein